MASLVAGIGATVMGAFAWTLAEYGLHRFYGHEARSSTGFSRMHLRHHAMKDYFAVSAPRAALVVAVLGGMVAASAATRSPALPCFVLGFGLGYGAYEILHRRLHLRAPPTPGSLWGRYGRWARVHHFHHHFEDTRKNYGVTSPLWDVVFGTRARAGVVRVPESHAMRWLLDGAGDVAPPYRDAYALRPRGARRATTGVDGACAEASAVSPGHPAG